MPARLSSLLVRDGLVGVKRMEKAFQRQVIYGGSLDTILLEMGLVPEERLTQYLALASGLPPAAPDEGAVVDPAAVNLITRELAERYRTVPVTDDRDALRILVCAPLELSELEDLADLLDRPLQPLITPEYRWHLVYANAYGVDPPARFTTLARALDIDPASTPVGRAPTVIVDNPGHPAAPTVHLPVAHPTLLQFPPIAPDAHTIKLASLGAAPPAHDDTGRGRRPTIIGVTPNRATTDGIVAARATDDDTPPSGRARRTSAGSALSAPHPSASASASGTARLAPELRRPAPQLAAEAATSGSPAPHPASDPDERSDAPLPIARAREILATADDRDTVFLTLLRAARGRARWAGLLTVQGGAAIGRIALAEPGIDCAAISTVLIPLDAVSPFRTVVTNHHAHVGPLTSGDPGIDTMVLRMGGTLPPSALILPVVLRDRVVALIIAHRVHSDLRLVDVTELLPLATAVSDALGRLIVKQKTAGYRVPSGAQAVVEIAAEQIDTKRIARADVHWRADEGAASVPSFEQGLEMEAGEPRPIDEVLSEIERAEEHGADDALAEAVERAPEAVRALLRRFPGKLRIDRFAVTGRTGRAAQYGGLLELVIRLGAAAADLLIDRMAAPQRDVRFYATVCTAELRPRNAVYALAERLFDQDFGVRASAIEALAGYPAPELGHALLRARRAVHSNDPDVIAAATGAVVALGDADAIPDLIAVIERSDRGGEHARRALVALTAQDFGVSERKWRKWYDTARRRHRIEWLIEGLAHKEDAIRESAINVLRRLTGEYFGFHHDLPRKEREAAADRWMVWWREAGHRRFVTASENERRRPTAELPGRREP
jgi:hypothetical protein